MQQNLKTDQTYFRGHLNNFCHFQQATDGLRENDLPVKKAHEHCKRHVNTMTSMEVIDQAHPNKAGQIMDTGTLTKNAQIKYAL